MTYKLKLKDENPLWRNYMDNVKWNDIKSVKEIKIQTPFPSKSTSFYSEEEFLDKLKTDKDFFEKWGTIK